MLHALLLFAAVLLPACGDSTHALSIDVRSDLIPGVDVTEIQTQVFQEGVIVDSETLAITPERDLATGVRVAEFAAIPAGNYRVVVNARRVGANLGKAVVVGLQEDLVLLVVLSSACVDVACPAVGGDPLATECVEGRCEVPDCVGDCMTVDSGVADSAPVDAPELYPCPGIVDYFAGAGTGAAVNYARATRPDADTVVVVRSDGPNGGLSDTGVAGIGLADHLGAPLLLTPQDRLHNGTETYLRDELRPSRAFVIGGEMAFSTTAEMELRGVVGDVMRIGGSGMSATAADVARRVGNNDGRAVIVSATDEYLPEIAAVAAVAAALDRPLLYAHRGNSAPAATLDALTDLGIVSLDIIGDEVAINPSMLASLMSVATVMDYVRYEEADDYRRATLVAETFAPAATTAGLVPLSNPLLALVAGASGQPILWVDPNALPTTTADYLRTSPIASVRLMGPITDREAIERPLCAILAP